MSRFLAPIHQLMYGKIHYLDSIVDNLLEDKPLLADEVNQKFEQIEKEPLADVIDHENIHGWLQERVERVERRLAYVASCITKDEGEDLLLERFFQAGLKQNFSGTADEAFSIMNQTFLDGMPCDHVNQLVEQNPEKVSWIVTKDLHRIYYQYGVEGQVYDKMRGAWLEGLLSKTNYQVYLEDNKYTIK